MVDADLPSLLALPYLVCFERNDRIYQNYILLVWSNDNPFFLWECHEKVLTARMPITTWSGL